MYLYKDSLTSGTFSSKKLRHNALFNPNKLNAQEAKTRPEISKINPAYFKEMLRWNRGWFPNCKKTIKHNVIAQKVPVVIMWTLKAFLPNHLVNFLPFNWRIKFTDSTKMARKANIKLKKNIFFIFLLLHLLLFRPTAGTLVKLMTINGKADRPALKS